MKLKIFSSPFPFGTESGMPLFLNLTLFYMPDDFGPLVHMKQSVANKQM